jgi:hypothetical protein
MLRHTYRRRLLVAAAAAAAAALALCVSASATGAYKDITGDGAGAPDIGQVEVASDLAGQIVFTVHVDNWPEGGDVSLYLFLDADMNPATGAPDTYGADYIFGVFEAENGYGFAHWNGTEWADTSASTVHVTCSSSGVTISVNKSELGNTGEFNFWTRTRAGAVETNQSDDSPNDGAWNYSLAANGPDIVGVLVAMSPVSGPAQGKSFTFRTINLKLPSSGEAAAMLPTPESYKCAGKLAGRVLRGTGVGGCTWMLPRKSRGKRFDVALTVTYQGASKTVPFTYKVR